MRLLRSYKEKTLIDNEALQKQISKVALLLENIAKLARQCHIEVQILGIL